MEGDRGDSELRGNPAPDWVLLSPLTPKNEFLFPKRQDGFTIWNNEKQSSRKSSFLGYATKMFPHCQFLDTVQNVTI